MANVLRLDELIREVRGQKVIFDTDLARICDITGWCEGARNSTDLSEYDVLGRRWIDCIGHMVM